ncbi:STAS domain-containing protein [Nonomuraea sp. NPDC050783]|uniref:STAS domain-containing protein n=1 Tax=Nonomuraea sp. NPDC050783 TaxID=3154634 RepID=UPI003466E797
MSMTTDVFRQGCSPAAAPDWLTVHVEERQGHAVVRLDGELDLLTRPRLTAACQDLMARGIVRIVINAANLRFCDCAGLSALLLQRDEARERGGSLFLIGAHGTLARLLDLTGAAGALLPAISGVPAQPPCPGGSALDSTVA